MLGRVKPVSHNYRGTLTLCSAETIIRGRGGHSQAAVPGGIAKWLRRRIANPLFLGSNPSAAFTSKPCLVQGLLHVRGRGGGALKDAVIPELIPIYTPSAPKAG